MSEKSKLCIFSVVITIYFLVYTYRLINPYLLHREKQTVQHRVTCCQRSA